MKIKFQNLFVVIWLFVFSFSAMAQNRQINNRVFEVADFSGRVVETLPTTYDALLKEVFPDFVSKGKTGIRSKRLRRIFSQPDGEPFEISGVYLEKCLGVWLLNQGKRHLALLIFLRRVAPIRSLDNSFYVLAAFRLDDELKLTDAVDVKFRNYYLRADFWGEAPLLPVREGEDAIWLAGRREDSRGNRQIDYRLLTLRDNRFAVILDELPTLKNASGAIVNESAKRVKRFEAKQRLDVLLPKSNPAYYRPFTLEVHESLRTFRMPYRPGIMILEPQDAPPDYDKTLRYSAVWDEKERRYKVSLENAMTAFSPLPETSGVFDEISNFEGSLEVGRTYAAQIKRVGGKWQLARSVNFPQSKTIRIEFDDREGVLTKLKNNAFVRFLVVKQETSNNVKGNSTTVFELKILSAQ